MVGPKCNHKRIFLIFSSALGPGEIPRDKVPPFGNARNFLAVLYEMTLTRVPFIESLMSLWEPTQARVNQHTPVHHQLDARS